jgi:hypothetical protein
MVIILMGSLRSRQDDGRTAPRLTTRMGFRRCRRLPSRNQRRENAAGRSSNRRRPRSLARDSAHSDRRMDLGEKECSVGLLSVEARVSRETPGRAGSAVRLPDGNPATVASAPALASRTLHDRTDAREPTGSARRADPRSSTRCRPFPRRHRSRNPSKASAERRSLTPSAKHRAPHFSRSLRKVGA